MLMAQLRDVSKTYNIITPIIISPLEFSAYQACAGGGGSGVHLHGKQGIHHRVEGDMFSAIYAKIDVKTTNLIAEMALSIQEQITTICENIDDGLRAIMTADVSMFERYPMFFRKLGRVLVDVRGAAERWDGGER